MDYTSIILCCVHLHIIMKTFYTTNRLILRILDENDAKEVLTFYNLNKDYFEAWEPDRVPGFYSIDFQKANLSYEKQQFLDGKMLRLWISEKNSPDVIIGSISFTNFMKGSMMSCMLGYKIDHYSAGQGFATEALDCTIDIMFNEYHFHRIEALVHPDNKPSQRIMDKLNFVYEGTARSCVKLDGIWTDHLRYVLINLAV